MAMSARAANADASALANRAFAALSVTSSEDRGAGEDYNEGDFQDAPPRIANVSREGVVLHACNGRTIMHRFAKLERRGDWPLFCQNMELVAINLGCHPSEIEAEKDECKQRQLDATLQGLLEKALVDTPLYENVFNNAHEPATRLAGLDAWNALVAWHEVRSVASKMELYKDLLASLQNTTRGELTPQSFARSVAVFKGLAGQFRSLGTTTDELIMLGFLAAIDARQDNFSCDMAPLGSADSLKWTDIHRMAREFLATAHTINATPLARPSAIEVGTLKRDLDPTADYSAAADSIFRKRSKNR